MRTLTSILILAIVLGCEPDVIDRGRRDTGVVADSGIGGPLPLSPGMTFVYDATLTYRTGQLGAEQTSKYMLRVTIASVDDQGVEGESSLTFTATGAQTLDDDWQATSDFDLWVARLGPSLRDDTISPVAITEPLTDPPSIPPFPSPPPKQLPQPGSFFIDVRAMDRIGAAFTEAHQDMQPQLVSPDLNATGKWVFSYAGEDPSTIFYLANKRRSMRLEYDPSGWLTRIDETIGDSSTPPSADARLILMSGP
jgi:hypothetical protein